MGLSCFFLLSFHITFEFDYIFCMRLSFPLYVIYVFMVLYNKWVWFLARITADHIFMYHVCIKTGYSFRCVITCIILSSIEVHYLRFLVKFRLYIEDVTYWIWYSYHLQWRHITIVAFSCYMTILPGHRRMGTFGRVVISLKYVVGCTLSHCQHHRPAETNSDAHCTTIQGYCPRWVKKAPLAPFTNMD